jgi:photosystem II stability/assembly factor-like uncharacterized protein
MCKRWFLALVAALVAVPSFAGRETSFLTRGPEGGPVLGFAFSPADPNVVVACGYYGSIYSSENGGQTWTRTPSAGSLGGAFTAAFDPSTPSVVYAGVTIGVGRSTDSGKTWTLTSHGLPGNRISALFVDPAHSGTVLAGSPVGLFRTTDSGANWSPFGTGLPAGKSVSALSADPTNPQTLLATAGDGDVFRSTDGGAAWAPVSGLPPSPSIFHVAFDPTTPGRAFTGESNVYRSTDHGASWNPVSDSSFVGSLAGFAFLPGAVFVASNNGIQKSTNGGVSWTKVQNGIPHTETFINALAVSPGSSPIILAGVEANGVLRSTNGGASWAVAKTGMTGNVTPIAIAIDPSNPKRAVVGLNFSGAVRTTDGGGTWTWIDELGINTTTAAVAVPGASGRFVAGAYGTYLSTDGGVTWHLSPDIVDNVYALAAGTSAGHPIFAGTGNTGVWKSTDGGATWHPSSAGLPSPVEVRSLSVGPAPASIVYAGLADGSVRRSTDSGGSWHPAGSPDSSRVWCLAADPNHDNVVYAGTDNALYKSTDGGSSWSSLNAAIGISADLIFGIAIPAQEPGTVFVAIFGGGALVSHDDGASWGQIDPHFPHVLYSSVATAIATDATGQWVYEGSLAAGIFVKQPVRIDPVDEAAPKKVKGASR